MGYLSKIKEYACIFLNGLVASCYAGCAMVGKLFKFAFGCLPENVRLFSTMLGETPGVNNDMNDNSLNNNSNSDSNFNSNSNSDSHKTESGYDVDNSGAQDGGGHAVSNVEKSCYNWAAAGSLAGSLVGFACGYVIYHVATPSDDKGHDSISLFSDIVLGVVFGGFLGNAIGGVASASSNVDRCHKSLIAGSMLGIACVASYMGSKASYKVPENLTLEQRRICHSFNNSCFWGGLVGLVGTVYSAYSALNKQDDNLSVNNVQPGDNANSGSFLLFDNMATPCLQ